MEKTINICDTKIIADDVRAMLAGAVDADALPDVLRQVDCGAASLFVGRFDDDALAGSFVLRVDRLAAGADGVIVAVAAQARGVRFADFLPEIEKRFAGVSRVRVHTSRPGVVRLLAESGYRLFEFVMVKPC